jgi:AbrB family looped-hinge helix DNA binding protein
MKSVKLSSKNQIVLPKEARDAMNVRGGDELLVVVKGKTTLIMAKPSNYSKAFLGKGVNLYSKDPIKKERRSW